MKNLFSATLVWFIVVGLDLVTADDIYRGILTLDDFTFDKIVSKFRYSLLKFDNPYPYGKEHENFVRLGRELSPFSQIVVANLEVKDFGAKDSFEIAKRYGINREQFPALVLAINNELKTDDSELMTKMKKDRATFIKYPEQRNKTTDKIVLNPSDMRLFVWKYTDGEIRATLPNCTKQLDRLAEKFVKLLESNGEEQEFQDIFAKVSKISQTKTQPEVENYRRLMEKGKERGTLFYESELERLNGLLDSNSITIVKRNELNAYRNVLHSFLPVSAVLVDGDKSQIKTMKKKNNNKKVEL